MNCAGVRERAVQFVRFAMRVAIGKNWRMQRSTVHREIMLLVFDSRFRVKAHLTFSKRKAQAHSAFFVFALRTILLQYQVPVPGTTDYYSSTFFPWPAETKGRLASSWDCFNE